MRKCAEQDEPSSAHAQEDRCDSVNPAEITDWLLELVEGFEFDVIGLARSNGKPHYPLPTEPGALAHILETSAAGYLSSVVSGNPDGVSFRRGGQREYPDIELSGGRLLNHLIVALDIKAARRGTPPARQTTPRRTKSRITLLTGDTYFAKPDVKHANVPRPYGEYALHLDWVIVFSIDETAAFPEVSELEHVVAQTWQIASKSRSSTTRNYIGAVTSISDLKQKKGEFSDRDEFESFWRSYIWPVRPAKKEPEIEVEDEENT